MVILGAACPAVCSGSVVGSGAFTAFLLYVIDTLGRKLVVDKV